MPAYFFDSSALVKFYVNETGTVWVRSFTDFEDNVIHVASLAKVETVSALTRRLRRRDIAQTEFDDACDDLEQDFVSQYRVVALTEEIIEEAANLAKKHGLRAYDAVQLAAALDTSRVISQIASTQLTLVSADLELNAAAIAEGLATEDPNTH